MRRVLDTVKKRREVYKKATTGLALVSGIFP